MDHIFRLPALAGSHTGGVPQPVLFLAHGSPTLAIEGGGWGPALRAFAAGLERPAAVLVVSAHWEARGAPRITSASRPGIVHDFGGFPEALYRLDYPCTGDPALAARIGRALGADLDCDRPLDHGAWVPLRWMFADADVPALQLSLPVPRDSGSLQWLGERLRPFRAEGVLVVGSGGLVHNLRRIDWADAPGAPEPWAAAFEDWALRSLDALDPHGFAEALPAAPGLREAVPTTEHFDPLYVCLGAADAGAKPHSLYAGWQMRNLSLRCLWWP